MTISINPEDQEDVNRVRIDLAQAVIDLAEVYPHPDDIGSRQAKEKAIAGLRLVRQRLERLGLTFSNARMGRRAAQ